MDEEEEGNPFIDVLHNVVGLTPAFTNVIIAEGINDAQILARVDDTTITEMFAKQQLRNVTVVMKMKFRALRYWAQMLLASNRPIELEDFTAVTANRVQLEMSTSASFKENKTRSSTKSDATAPEKFNGKARNWKEWSSAFTGYLAQLPGSNDIPLSYVVRDDEEITQEDYEAMEGTMKQIYDAELQGIYFDRDNYQVYQKIKSQLSGGIAETHLTEFEKTSNGRAAWMHLKTCYEGEDAKNTAISQARKEIRDASWERNTRNWTFDSYCLRHIKAYNTLKKYGIETDGATKVRDFLHGIHNSHVQAIKTTILLNPATKTDLERAIVAFKDSMAALDIVSNNTIANQDDRKIGAITRGGGRGSHRGRNQGGRSAQQSYNPRQGYRGGYKGGRGSGGRFTGGRGQGQSQQSDDGLLLDKKILDQMTPKQRAAFYQGREKMRANPRTEAATTSSNVDRNVGATNLAAPPAYMPPPPPVIQVHSNEDESRLSAASSQFGKQGQTSRNLQNKVGAVLSSDRRSYVPIPEPRSSKSINRSGEDYSLRARAEMDSRADTICAGATFVLLEDTRKICDVGGFHESMPSIKGVPVGTCATAYDHPDLQETLILCFPQSLYFGNQMEHSLINPNQLRDFGIRVDSTPKQYDPNSNHAIMIPEEDIVIPLKLHGCISYFPTRLPTPQELNDCRYIELSSEQEWNPYSDRFGEQERPFRNRVVAATSTTDRRHEIDAPTLAQRLGVSHHVAKHTLGSTSQLAIRHLNAPMRSRVRTRQTPLRYRRLNALIYSDTLFSSTKSIRGNTCAQIFTTDKHFLDVHPMKTKGEAGDKLNEFLTTTGIPEGLITDGAKEEFFGRWGEVRKKFLLHQRQTEPHSPWQNKAEDAIRDVKDHYRRIMDRKKVPEALWDFGMEYTAYVRNRIAHPSLNNRSPYEILTGDSPDISELLDFSFYDWVKVYDPAPFPEQRESLARWLGPAHNVGQALCFYVLKANGQVIARSSVRALTETEISDPSEQNSRDEFDKSIKEALGAFDPELILDVPIEELEEPLPDPPPRKTSDPPDDVTHGPDPLINASLILPRGDRAELGKVVGRKRNNEGLLVGRKHRNPALDSRIYLVEFNDGEQQEISYNLLAEHLYSQCDSEGRQHQIFREIIHHRKTKAAVDKEDQYTNINNKRCKKKTLAGWDLEVEWRDGSTSWIPLKEIKNTNPVETAEYAAANRISLEPAFDWWVHEVLRKKQRLIKMSRSHRIRTGYKFGLRVPDTPKEAYEIDRENGNTFWADAITKEMQNNYVAFDVKGPGEKAPPGYKHIPHRMVFEIKLDFTRKARLVAGGHKTDPPIQMTYSSVVSRESVRIAFLIAALNDIDLMAADVGNAYLNAPTKEKVYIITGPEFGPEEGRVAVIVRALYGLKSSGAQWRSHFAATLRDLGFQSCLADPDVWFRPATKDNDDEYYEYILVYVDDLLVCSHKAAQILTELEERYKYRLKDVGPPKRYLGAIIGKYELDHNCTTWFLTAQEYLEKALPIVEQKQGTLATNKVSTPLPSNCHPELDESPFLSPDDVELYQSYIGTLRWAVELGRIDLTFAASLMARFAACPREGHMENVIHVFAYIKKHLRSKLVFDPYTRDWSDINWIQHDWSEFYPDAMEAIPPNAPKPRGKPVQINLFCDAAHANDYVTRRSTTGIIFFLQGAPISWYSKRQNTIETSTFGSEFVALKIATEQNEALRYKLRMMGIPIDGKTNLFCDNDSVVRNVTDPASTLSKKHNAICYHKVREAVAAGIQRIAFERGMYNVADFLTKNLLPNKLKDCSRCALF